MRLLMLVDLAVLAWVVATMLRYGPMAWPGASNNGFEVGGDGPSQEPFDGDIS